MYEEMSEPLDTHGPLRRVDKGKLSGSAMRSPYPFEIDVTTEDGTEIAGVAHRAEMNGYPLDATGDMPVGGLYLRVEEQQTMDGDRVTILLANEENTGLIR